MPHALIVAHGQPSDPEPAEAALAAYAADVDTLCEGVDVKSATLAAPGVLERRVAALPDDAVIYPLFMAKGWFVTSALPKRLADRNIRILDPLGVEPSLPGLVSETLTGILAGHGWSPQDTELVLAAHGSGRSRNPSAVAREFAVELRKKIAFKAIHTGFVEEPPYIAEAAANLSSQALCLPFFACAGGHVLEDLPEALSEARFSGRVLPVVGELPLIKQHIALVLASTFKEA
ncbi:CbiX/SirB N-terminal domain-containing protein [Ruegeria sp.]|uniref:CbiX/SirB N-terminal domain-containing protein n=1 Tax=Ruegeria sp. TaxID=1879320 RepID=UPI003B58F621